MILTYYKRYRMELRLRRWGGCPPPPPPLPPGYRVLGWQASLADAFAEAKYLSFRGEMDAQVFPCLGRMEGCRRLMREIVAKRGFLPEATWLLIHEPADGPAAEFCGTVQGIGDREGFGAVQNLGVTPAHRGRGLGTHLMIRALGGFRQAGLRRVRLEVTAENLSAIRLYERLGFRTVRTVFKAAEAEPF
jgi:ribosomal protein S18 acetylase RimI-like enzyme